jgi:hypothetical protein
LSNWPEAQDARIGNANANINNGSYDPDGDAITLTQMPAGPYPVGTNSVILTVVDTEGATAQATANVTVVNPGFTLAAMTPSVSATAGKSATEQLTYTPTPGVSGAVTLACSNLPAKSACSFAPSTVPSGDVQTTVALTISTTASTAAAIEHPPIFYAAWLPFTGLGLLGFAFMIPGKRRKASTMFTLLVLGVSMFAVGCGGSSSSNNKTISTPHHRQRHPERDLHRQCNRNLEQRDANNNVLYDRKLARKLARQTQPAENIVEFHDVLRFLISPVISPLHRKQRYSA